MKLKSIITRALSGEEEMWRLVFLYPLLFLAAAPLLMFLPGVIYKFIAYIDYSLEFIAIVEFCRKLFLALTIIFCTWLIVSIWKKVSYYYSDGASALIKFFIAIEIMILIFTLLFEIRGIE